MEEEDESFSEVSSSDYTDESEEELFEPKLKYDRMKNDLITILKDDFASCLTIHPKFFAFGTHWGAIHVLDHEGNRIREKKFARHHACVTGIAMDASAEYVASCSDDGLVVVSGLYTDEHNQIVRVDRPVKSIALDPLFSQSSSKQLVFGTERLVLSERGWLRGNKQTVLHQGEGCVRKIRWRGQLIAWANDNGVKLYDTKQRRRIQHIPRSGAVSDTSSTVTGRIDAGPGGTGGDNDDEIRCEISPAHIAWKDDATILIGWAYDIKVCLVKERASRRDVRERTKYCVIAHMFQTDFLCCGIAPLGDQIVAFAYVQHEDDDDDDDDDGSSVSTTTGSIKPVNDVEAKGKGSEACRPQVRILEANPIDSKSYIEVSRDALSISGYEGYRCADYSIEFNDCEMLIVSPRDVVIARRRDEDDHITWLLDMNKYRQAMATAKLYGRKLKKHNLTSVGIGYLRHLLARGKYLDAAELCQEVLGKNRALWEDTIEEFRKAGRVGAIAMVIPHTEDDFLLTSQSYDAVLCSLLEHNHENFVMLLEKWSRKLYNITTMITKLLKYMDEHGRKKILLAALAKLYAADQRYDRALSIYLQLQHPDTFDLIRKHNLFAALQDNILPLMQFGGSKAIELLLDHMDYVPIDKVVSRLESKPGYLHQYLSELFLRDGHLGSEYHGLQVRLFADFDRDKLLPFLKSSNYIPLEEALSICEQRNLIDEQVFLLGRMGNASRALSLITDLENDISRAVKFCKEQNDDVLWDELINKTLDKPDFIRVLLENIGTHVDPIKLIRKIPNGMRIPGLRDALVKILQDYSMQTALWYECKRIISSDVLALMRKQLRIQHRPLYIDDESVCDSCGRTLLYSGSAVAAADDPIIVCFFCKHLFHDTCLQGRDRGTCPVCRGKMRHVTCS